MEEARRKRRGNSALGRTSISSPWTAFWKYVYGPLWGGTFLVLAAWALLHGQPEGWWYLLGAVIALSASWYYFFGLKTVEIAGDRLYVSDYRTTLEVPLSEVVGIEETIWLQPHPVRIYFRTRTAFGQSITFAPRGFCLFSSHPIVTSLRGMAVQKGGSAFAAVPSAYRTSPDAELVVPLPMEACIARLAQFRGRPREGLEIRVDERFGGFHIESIGLFGLGNAPYICEGTMEVCAQGTRFKERWRLAPRLWLMLTFITLIVLEMGIGNPNLYHAELPVILAVVLGSVGLLSLCYGGVFLEWRRARRRVRAALVDIFPAGEVAMKPTAPLGANALPASPARVWRPAAQVYGPPKPLIVIAVVAVILGAVFVLLPATSHVRESAKRASCKSNLRQINIALHLYADDNDGAFPENFQQLYQQNYTDNAKIFSCPSEPSQYTDFKLTAITDKSSSYTYVLGLNSAMPGNFILAYDKANHKAYSEMGRKFEGGRNVLFVDSHVDWWPVSREAELQQRLEKQREQAAVWRPGPQDAPADRYVPIASIQSLNEEAVKFAQDELLKHGIDSYREGSKPTRIFVSAQLQEKAVEVLRQALKGTSHDVEVYEPKKPGELKPPAPSPATTGATKDVEISKSGDRTLVTVSGSGRALKNVNGHVQYVPVDASDVERAAKGLVFVFEPVEERIVDHICALASVNEISVWYGSFTPQQRDRILQKFPKCVIHENLNKI